MQSTTAFSQNHKKYWVASLPHFLAIIFVCFLNVNTSAQVLKKLEFAALAQAHFGLYDETLRNNSFGLGAGLNITYQTQGKVQPLLELNADLFSGTKDLRTTSDGRIIEAKSQVLSIYAGPQLVLGKRFFASTTAGASFFNENTHLGIRPSLGYHFTPNGRWMMKSSITHIFNAEAISGNPFGYLSVALGFKF